VLGEVDGHHPLHKSLVTLPKPIRDYLKVAPGDQVEFRIMADGSASVAPVPAYRRSGASTPLAKAKLHFAKLRGCAPTDMSTGELMRYARVKSCLESKLSRSHRLRGEPLAWKRRTPLSVAWQACSCRLRGID
jgi:bifunctional DNA-binding transcriptional regulator/antitoxin component of YhaV-PrlF toxin-antitoxin module